MFNSKDFTKHFSHYLPLLIIFAVGIVGFTLFSYERIWQIIISIIIAFAYVVWGLVHHFIHKDLYPEVIVEYLVFASLGLIIIFSLVLRV